MAESKPKQEKKNRPLTPEQDRYVKKLGIEKSLRGTNPLSHEALQKIINHFKDNPNIDLNQIQDEENPYKLFTKALNKGLFPNQGKNAVEFLKALKGSPAERKLAKEFISDLAHDGGQISTSKEKEALTKLKEIRDQNYAENAQTKVGTTINLLSNTAATWEKFAKILDKSEREQLNYKPGKLSEAVSARLKQISTLNGITQTALELEDEMEALLKLPDAEKDDTIQFRVKNIEKDLAVLDKKIDKLVLEILEEEAKEVTPEILEKFSKKMLDINKNVMPHMERELNRADNLRMLSQKVGVPNICNSKTFKVKKEGKDGKIFSTERERIQIKEIYFEEENDEDDPSILGGLNIKYSYMDREGQENKIEERGDLSFIRHFIYLLDGYEDETISRTPQENDYMPKEGETFSSATLGQFKVEEIKNGKIITDKELKVIPKEWLPRNAKNNEEVYQDQKKKEFTKKEFTKVLLQHSCSAGGDGGEFLPDKILEKPAYPENLKKPQEESREEVKKLEKDIEGEVKKEAEEELIKESEEDEDTKEGSGQKQEDIKNDNEKEYWEEAVPYDIVHKVNKMETKAPPGILRKFYNETTFLSVSDIFHLVKTCWEFYKRRFEVKQKERYSEVAKNLPYFGGEMERVNQSAKNEEVHQYKDAYEHKGIPFIQERMRVTNYKHEMKACFEVLVHKGQMRFEDIDIWRNMNKFLPYTKYIPLPKNGDPNTIISEDKHSPFYMKTGISLLEGGIDYLWGPGTYGEWFAQNKSAFKSGSQKFYEEGKKLEGVEGGHTRRLAELLLEHKEGNFVDPQEYEGLILHAIDAGKGDLETKVYYMVAGVVAKDPQGRAILPNDRIAHINGEMLGKFPILEYMCSKAPRLKPDGTVKGERLNLEDYENWLNYFDGGNRHNCSPTQNVTRFIWKYMIPSEKTHTRINKALRNAEGMDHDDMHAYLPPASTNVLTDACKTVSGGGKHLLTIEGYANAVAGFDEYMKNLAKNGQKKQLAQAFCSYVRYEGILMNKYDKDGKEGFIRMDDRTLNKKCVVAPNKPIMYMKELNPLVLRVAEAYKKKGYPELLKLVKSTQQDSKNWDLSKTKDRKEQNKVEHAYNTFDNVFMRTIKTDGGDLMMKLTKEVAEADPEKTDKVLTGVASDYEEPVVKTELKKMEEW